MRRIPRNPEPALSGPSVSRRGTDVLRRIWRGGSLATLVLLSSTAPVRAQTLQSGGPLVLADGNVTIGGEGSVTVGPNDPGFFNYSDYDRSLLRLLQFDLTGSAKAGDHLTYCVGENVSRKISPVSTAL